MPANCPSRARHVSALAPLVASLVLAGCGGPGTPVPATPSPEEIRESERALEAAAAAEKPLTGQSPER